jgi:hypothetical protein
MLIYQEFLVLNEDMAAYDPNERLRYCVHEIIMTMKSDETMTFTHLSTRLKDEWKIDIPANILKTIFEAWDSYQNANYTVFKKEDKNWMDVWPYQNYVKRKSRDKQNFGKHRKKDVGTYYSDNSMGGHWSGRQWVPSKNNKNNDGRFYNNNNINNYYEDDQLPY